MGQVITNYLFTYGNPLMILNYLALISHTLLHDKFWLNTGHIQRDIFMHEVELQFLLLVTMHRHTLQFLMKFWVAQNLRVLILTSERPLQTL